MLWPLLTFLALATLVGVHLAWRRKFAAAQTAARGELERLKQAEQTAALQAQQQQEALFDSMAEGLLLLGRDGRIQLANRSFNQLFGITRHIRGQTLMEALRLHELAELVDFVGTARQVLGHELKLLPPNERCLEVNGAALFDASGSRYGTVLVFHDLTRLKQLEGTRQEFVANVSHELRTPLSLIKGYVETLLDGARENPELTLKFLRTIDRNAERLKLLIEDLLTISALESGRLKLMLQSVQLRPLVQKVLADYEQRAQARKVTLVNTTPELCVHADPDRLEQVIGNLVDNGIKYGRSEGRVSVSARALEQGQVEVAVQDDGVGIPLEALERVFERFYRVDKARSREQGGTGLGLSIVKHIVQNHGGKAWARSEPGQGTTFLFTLPREPLEVHPSLA